MSISQHRHLSHDVCTGSSNSTLQSWCGSKSRPCQVFPASVALTSDRDTSPAQGPLACQEDRIMATGSPPHFHSHSHSDIHIRAECRSMASTLVSFKTRCKPGLTFTDSRRYGDQTIRTKSSRRYLGRRSCLEETQAQQPSYPGKVSHLCPRLSYLIFGSQSMIVFRGNPGTWFLRSFLLATLVDLEILYLGISTVGWSSKTCLTSTGHWSTGIAVLCALSSQLP